MKRLLLSGFWCLSMLPGLAGAAGIDRNYINDGVVLGVDLLNTDFPLPQIDAINFINHGSFTVYTLVIGLPYETSDTLNYTNTGTMTGSPGFRFDLTPSRIGQRRSAANFVNDSFASITCNDATDPLFGFLKSYLYVFATNVVNRGTFSAGNSGLIQIIGSHVDLSQSQMTMGSVQDSSRGNSFLTGNTVTNYIPDTAIYDQYWASTNFNPNPGPATMDTSLIWHLVTSSNWIVSTNFLGTNLVATLTTNVYRVNDVVASTPPGADLGLPIAFDNPAVLVTTNVGGGVITNTTISLPWTNNPLAVWTTNILTVQDLILTNGSGNDTPGASTQYVILPRMMTNLTKQAIFVLIPSSPAFSIQTGFKRETGNPTFKTAGVLISLRKTNSVTSQVETQSLFIQDTLASQPSLGLLVNNDTGTYRPTNYLFEWGDSRFQSFVPADGTNPPIDFFTSSGNSNLYRPSPPFVASITGATLDTNYINLNRDSVTNVVVSGGDVTAYEAFMDNVSSRPPAVTGGTITNLAGSIRITADDLDLTRAHMVANGMISIKAKNLISSSHAAINCENLSFDVGSTNGDLTVQDLAPARVSGIFRGSISAWSAHWTNAVDMVFSNNVVFSLVGTNMHFDPAPLTNEILVQYHVLILDASQLVNNEIDVSVYDYILRGNRIVVNDTIKPLQNFLIDGRIFTLNGTLTFPGVFPVSDPINNATFPGVPIKSWINTNAPKLLYFTNNGTISIPNEAHFGDDRLLPKPLPYVAFVNNSGGTISAASLHVNSAYFENDGSLSANVGSFTVQCGTGRFRGRSSSAGSSQFIGDNFLVSGASVNSGDSLTFVVTNRLSDGEASNTRLNANNGINMLLKPRTGDLLASTLNSQVPSATPKIVVHRWAGEDRGPTPAGYTNNIAVGRLVLSPTTNTSTFRFTGTSPTGVTNALYVDLLDLSSLGSHALSSLQIDPNIVIYYAAVRLQTNVTLPFQLLAEEYLDGKLNGHLRWVRDYAGSFSSTNALINGVPRRINTALRNSQIIDSGNTGTSNNLKSNFLAAHLNVQVSGNGMVIPNYSSQSLLVGETWSLIAQPARGSKFLGWSGSITSRSPQLTFVMPTNGLSLTARFSFPTAAAYRGLFYGTNGVQFARSGLVGLNTTASGSYSGSLWIGGKRYGFSGKLDDSNADSRVVGPYRLDLQAGDDQMTGTISSNTSWSVDLVLNRAVFNADSHPAPYAGRYTLIFPGSGDPTDTEKPQGDGYGVVTVSKSGAVQLSGSLADGARISQGASVSEDGQWPLYVPLYKGVGQILSWQTFTAEHDLRGLFSWIKQSTTGRFYPGGFILENNAVGSLYNPSLRPVTIFTDGTMLLQGANLAAPISSLVKINSNNGITIGNYVGGKLLSLTLDPSQGVFNGRFQNPANPNKPVSFSGAILQNGALGTGYFLGTNLSGMVSFGP